MIGAAGRSGRLPLKDLHRPGPRDHGRDLPRARCPPFEAGTRPYADDPLETSHIDRYSTGISGPERQQITGCG